MPHSLPSANVYGIHKDDLHAFVSLRTPTHDDQVESSPNTIEPTILTMLHNHHVSLKGAPAQSDDSDEAYMSTIKRVILTFLNALPYKSPQSPQNPEMRRVVAAEIISWDAGLSCNAVNSLTDTSCTIAECAYAHTSYQHQLLAALYTAYLTYMDDIGEHNVSALEQFARRFVRGEVQSLPALDRLTTLLGTVHDFCPTISADSVIKDTIDSLIAMYIEVTTKGDHVHPAAARYPFYLRLKTGIASAYAHLMFTRTWEGATGAQYLPIVPELELITVGFNDILSFYKETLAGDTDNYVHMRAGAEGKSPLLVLCQLVSENLESVRKIEEYASTQPGLSDVCRGFMLGYIEFHINAGRYRLGDFVDIQKTVM